MRQCPLLVIAAVLLADGQDAMAHKEQYRGSRLHHVKQGKFGTKGWTYLMNTADGFHAFCKYNNFKLEPTKAGPLSGFKFAAKDIFDLTSHVTGAGNPDWLRTHQPAKTTAPIVQKLLNAGAELAGVTKLTELTRTLIGENAHYGTPKNPRAPGHVPGGSSSGSASAVAGELVDFALGSDTNGSIRLPASFCGLFGVRPTHGRLPLDGVFEHAASFDTVGWFSRDAELLARIGETLLDTDVSKPPPPPILIADDAFALADPSVQSALSGPLKEIGNLGRELRHIQFCPVDLKVLASVRLVIHTREAWDQFKGWFADENPRLTFQVARACLNGEQITDEDVQNAVQTLNPIREHMHQLLENGAIVCFPTTASSAWPLGSRLSEITDSNARSSMLAAIGGSLGCPEVSLPLAETNGLPVGISIMGAPGSDEMLMGFAQTVSDAVERNR